MGFALAQAARDLGAEVTLVTGPSALADPNQVNMVRVETTRQMYNAVRRRFAKVDGVIMAAAPADFEPAAKATRKIKKGPAGLRLDLKPTVDILAELGARKKKQVVVGFALETENGVDNARKKLKAKNLDLIVLNSPRDPESAFDYDTNRVTIIRPGRRPEAWPLLSKNELAVKLLEIIAAML